MSNAKMSRRSLLAGSAAVPLAAALAVPSSAKAPMLGASQVMFNRFKLGAFEVTTLLAGTRTVNNPKTIFGLNVSQNAFERASAANFIPTDAAQFFFTPTVVNTGSELILFDTGLNPTSITETLEAAGYAASDVDTVVITHMHGDHVGGLADEIGPTFENARYVTGRVEYDTTAKTENKNFHAKVKPLAEQMAFLEDGGSVASGVTAMAAFGHTPGHMAYMLESDGQQLAIMADFANHYVWSLAYPDWEVKFDRDKPAAAATRRRMLDMLAADKLPFIGYHMPFPARGYVEENGDGYRYVPASYQTMME